MDRAARHRKVFDEKENDHKTLNKKPMMASINYKTNVPENSVKLMPTISHGPNHNIQFYDSVQPQRHSLNLPSRPSDLKRPQLQPIELLSNTRAYCKAYKDDLNTYFKQFMSKEGTAFLTGHQINSALRARMLDWMVEVTESYKFSPKTYFAGVYIMDTYFARETEAIPVQKLHIVGVVAMLIASKMEEVYPFRLKTIYEKIVHKKIPIKELVDMECSMFERMDFNTVSATFYDKIMLQLASYGLRESKLSLILDQSNPLKDEKFLEEIELYCSYIGKFACYNYEISSIYSKQVLADAVISLALEILDLSAPGITFEQSSFSEIEQCKTMIQSAIVNFKKVNKGLNNIFKFANESVVEKVDKYLA